MPTQKNSFAEIIESSLHTWRAQSWRWDDFPQFGSLVTLQTAERTVYGIVHQIETGSLDTQRTPFAFQKTEEELLREQPQIFAFLKTTFSCLTVGYKENRTLLYQWAPEPPKIHAFVARASRQEYEEFFSSEQYIHSLFGHSNQSLPIDELLLALLKQLADRNLVTEELLAQFVATFSLMTGNDYRRLKLFLQRVTPCLSLPTPLSKHIESHV